MAAAGLALLLAACAAPRYAPVERAPTFPTPTTVTAAQVLGRSADPAAELAALPRSSRPAVELRRAFLELELDHPDAAIDATSRVLYGQPQAAVHDQAYAHYLRAQAYVKRGTPELARYDLEQARRLTMDQELLALLDRPPAPTAAGTQALARLPIRSRARWSAARPDRRNLDGMDTVTRITIHHSAIYLRDDSETAAAHQVGRIQHEHMQGRGYGDIGYHFLVDPSGRIWQGRDLRWQGAHASGANNVRNAGICVLGNFVRGRGGQEPTRAQVAALFELVRAIQQEYDIPSTRIYRHRDFKATQCPGERMEPVMALLRGQAREADLARWE